MKQITLKQPGYASAALEPCLGRLILLGVGFGLAMAFLWEFAGPTPGGHAIAWLIALCAGIKLWRTIEEA